MNKVIHIIAKRVLAITLLTTLVSGHMEAMSLIRGVRDWFRDPVAVIDEEVAREEAQKKAAAASAAPDTVRTAPAPATTLAPATVRFEPFTGTSHTLDPAAGTAPGASTPGTSTTVATPTIDAATLEAAVAKVVAQHLTRTRATHSGVLKKSKKIRKQPTKKKAVKKLKKAKATLPALHSQEMAVLNDWITRHTTFLKKSFDFDTEQGRAAFATAAKATTFDITKPDNAKLLKSLSKKHEIPEQDLAELLQEEGGFHMWPLWIEKNLPAVCQEMISNDIEQKADGSLQAKAGSMLKTLVDKITEDVPENQKIQQCIPGLFKIYVQVANTKPEDFTFNYLKVRLMNLEKAKSDLRKALKSGIPAKITKARQALVALGWKGVGLGWKGTKVAAVGAGTVGTGYALYKAYPTIKLVAAKVLALLPWYAKYTGAIGLGGLAAWKAGSWATSRAYNWIEDNRPEWINGPLDTVIRLCGGGQETPAGGARAEDIQRVAVHRWLQHVPTE